MIMTLTDVVEFSDETFNPKVIKNWSKVFIASINSFLRLTVQSVPSITTLLYNTQAIFLSNSLPQSIFHWSDPRCKFSKVVKSQPPGQIFSSIFRPSRLP